jgi:Uma2 family endonuclease
MTRIQNKPIRRGAPEGLHSGDRMTQKEFHKIYEQMPEDFKAELLGGIVYVASAVGRGHGRHHIPLSAIFFAYEGSTPGVECGDNSTIILGKDSEPQPDLFLRIMPEFGGQSKTTDDDYIEGPPELVAEISHSSHGMDLHSKRAEYARCGVREYLVLSLKERQLRWFDLRANKELAFDADGICRIRAFPGLWIHAEGLLSRNYHQLMATLKLGLESAERAAFVKKLEAAHKK